MVVLISLPVSIIGSYFSTKWQLDNWESQKQIELRENLIEKRMEIIDRAANVMGKTNAAKVMWLIYEDDVKKMSQNNCKSSDIKDTINKLADYYGEFKSVINLGLAYFGPKTGRAISDLSDGNVSYWDIDPGKMQLALDAMRSEINYFGE